MLAKTIYHLPLPTFIPTLVIVEGSNLEFFLKDFYGAQYDYILLSKKGLYINIGRSRFFYTTETLIGSMR
jgi:hypothetical protein